MTWSVEWTDAATKSMRRLDRKLQERIRAAVQRLSESGHGDIRAFKEGRPGELAMRVGDWRVFFFFVHPEHVIRVADVRPRGSAYS